jgi:dTDP-4-amino-4,6-dideoxygalactose transaminase
VHLGGRFCDLAGLAAIAAEAGALLVEDAPHAVGGVDGEGRAAGACARSAAATFSLHPVKTLAAGEGGVVTLNDPERAERLRRLRNHGVTHEAARMVDPALSLGRDGAPHPWSYEQLEHGFNLRMDEMSAALALSQLGKLERFAERRRGLAALYDEALATLAPTVRPAVIPDDDQQPCLHLYQVLIDFESARVDRGTVMRRLAEHGIGTQVHYIPVHRQPAFRSRADTPPLPGAEAFYARALTLPLFPAMADDDVGRVVQALGQALA